MPLLSLRLSISFYNGSGTNLEPKTKYPYTHIVILHTMLTMLAVYFTSTHTKKLIKGNSAVQRHTEHNNYISSLYI